ncbi:MAG: aminotransferase class V-fold PLP-dependent enzyme [Acidobacteria bacterium]|nr:aminotransferase class V-fold PLP-dependent enzyme [Acidobacteriota bacterium]
MSKRDRPAYSRVKTKRQKIWFHTDAVQAAGKIEIDVESIGCDLLAFRDVDTRSEGRRSTIRASRNALHSQNIGGRQERGLRGGTESVPNIVALGKAAELGKKALADESAG